MFCGSGFARWVLGKESLQLGQLSFHFLDGSPLAGRKTLAEQDHILLAPVPICQQLRIGPRNREALFVQQLLYLLDEFQVGPSVDPLASSILDRFESRENGLPIAQNVRLNLTDLANFSDFVE